ncbi:sce7726 family protein [Paenibacillus sp. FSL K6-2524]|uniref:sce7726 family protein n=1 Tax=Paenibacillus sp. FSL K6-2524 TaxID=2954516 RepID=UPI0030FAD10F
MMEKESKANVNHNYLNRFFTKKYLIDKIYSEEFVSDLFLQELEKNYKLLNSEYRNEFFYKSILFNKYIIGKYSLKTSTALSEIVIDNSKADFIVLNRSNGIVFEIKTELDNFDRLIYQLNDYYKVFSMVNVVASEKNYYPVYKLLKETNPNVGIIVLTKNKRLSVRKTPIRDDMALNHEALFKLLRKNEYEKIILYKFGFIPDVKPVHFFRTLLELFKQINIIEAQTLVFKELNKREKSGTIEIIKYLPESIRWLVYSGKYNEQTLHFICEKLNLRGDMNVLPNNKR